MPVVSTPVDCVPEIALVPLQVPDAGLAVAVQEVALALLQVSVLLPPVVKLVGLADNTALGVVEPPPGGVVPHRSVPEKRHEV